jgi:hypothetical protein
VGEPPGVRGGAEGQVPSLCLPRIALSASLAELTELLCWAWQEAERAYLLWKARKVADQQGSGALTVEGRERGEEEKALVDWVVHGLKGDLFPDLMKLVG